MTFHPLRPELSDRGLLEVLSLSPSGDEKGEKIVYLSKKKKCDCPFVFCILLVIVTRVVFYSLT